jgi:hypothetical protein
LGEKVDLGIGLDNLKKRYNFMCIWKSVLNIFLLAKQLRNTIRILGIYTEPLSAIKISAQMNYTPYVARLSLKVNTKAEN